MTDYKPPKCPVCHAARLVEYEVYGSKRERCPRLWAGVAGSGYED